MTLPTEISPRVPARLRAARWRAVEEASWCPCAKRSDSKAYT